MRLSFITLSFVKLGKISFHPFVDLLIFDTKKISHMFDPTKFIKLYIRVNYYLFVRLPSFIRFPANLDSATFDIVSTFFTFFLFFKIFTVVWLCSFCKKFFYELQIITRCIMKFKKCPPCLNYSIMSFLIIWPESTVSFIVLITIYFNTIFYVRKCNVYRIETIIQWLPFFHEYYIS